MAKSESIVSRPEEQVLFVRPGGERPDFRLVITFLWGEFHDCDTDGDSFNPASREWTQLYCRNREESGELFRVAPVDDMGELVLSVSSRAPGLAERVAYFLARESQGGSWQSEGSYQICEALEELLGAGFVLADALERARVSVWRGATLERPYPNQGGSE